MPTGIGRGVDRAIPCAGGDGVGVACFLRRVRDGLPQRSRPEPRQSLRPPPPGGLRPRRREERARRGRRSRTWRAVSPGPNPRPARVAARRCRAHDRPRSRRSPPRWPACDAGSRRWCDPRSPRPDPTKRRPGASNSITSWSPGAVDVVRQWVRAVLGAVRRELIDLVLTRRGRRGWRGSPTMAMGLTSLSMSTLSIYQ